MINYNNPDDILLADKKDLLITDGTVTVSGTNYSVTGDTVTITNYLLDYESFELKQSLCSQQQITFGSCESNRVSFTIHENIPTIKGKTIKVYMIPDSDASKMLQLGVFKVAEDTLSGDRTKRSIVGYDAMYDIINSDVAAWYNTELPNSSSSKTLAQFRADFLSHFNITAESATLPNDSITIKRTIEPESLSGADVIKAICEINGVFGTITNEGKFRYVVLSPDLDAGLFPSDTLYPANDLYPQDVNTSVDIIRKSRYIDVQFEDYMSESITALTIRNDDSDAGTTVGSGTNKYVITGNFLVFGYNATQLTSVGTNALANMTNRYYKPCTVNAEGNPLHEVGDGIRISTTYRGIVSYIFERTMKGIQALRDTYSASGNKEVDGQLNSVSSQFKQLASKTMKIEADTDGLRVYVEEQLDDSVAGSYANLTAQEISLKVTKTQMVDDLDDEMSGIDITSNSIAIQSTGTFSVDSSNFRLDDTGALTIRNVTFDHSGSGYADMTISNGVIESGNMSLSYNQLSFGVTSTNIGDDYVNVPSTGQIGLGSYSITEGTSGLEINSAPILVGGTNATVNVGTNSTINTGNINLSGSLTVGGNTFLNDWQFCLDGHVLEFKTVRDTGGNTVHVLGY